MKQRKAGILLAIASLPGKYGIGEFNENAYKFVDLLKEGGFSLWQLLPLNPLGYGHSPYQPFSSFAIEELYLDLKPLHQAGLIKKLPTSFNENSSKILYEEVREYKFPYLKEAFAKEMELHPRCLTSFRKSHPWVEEYALFMMFKRIHTLAWNEWPIQDKNFLLNHSSLKGEQKQAFLFEIWLQKSLYEQWAKLKEYANKKGIEIIGDIPFYVGYDSVDVWVHPDQFLLHKKNLEPTFIAGVPPDYFSPTGQRWGNPIYNFKAMKKDNFAFLKNRIKGNGELYDILRLDHFRAFDTYWKIPSSCPTAIEGEWIEAPGYAFFDSLFKDDPSLQGRIIAEDLGDLRDEVFLLRDHYNFPGMNVIQFTFQDYEVLGKEKEEYDAFNSVAYLGTHDNDTTLSYFYSLSDFDEAYWILALRKYGIHDGSVVSRLIRYCLRKKAKYAILSMNDVLELDADARINVPSTVNDINWTWKLSSFKEFEEKLPLLKSYLEEADRLDG